MHILRKQNGMTAVGWIFLLIILIAAIPAIKIIPVYYKYYQINSALEDFKSDVYFHISAKNPENIKTELLNLFGKEVPEITSDDITITEAGDKYNIRIQHQFREKIMNDWYFTLNFDKSTYAYK